MPTISSSRFQPLVTPSTALLTRARASPCTAACESFSRRASRLLSCCCTLIPAGSGVSTRPFGPCTLTTLPSTLKVTPLGSGIGFFPIRDIKFRSSVFTLALRSLAIGLSGKTNGLLLTGSYQTFFTKPLLPNFAKQLTAHAGLARLSPGHDSLRSSENVDPQPAQHARNFIAPHIHAATGARNPLDIRDGGLVVVAILQIDAHNFVAFFFSGLEIGDKALFLQNAGDLQLQPRSRDIHFLVPRINRVANAR